MAGSIKPHTTYPTVMFSSPSCKYPLAFVAIFAAFIIHPIVLGETWNEEVMAVYFN